MSDPPATSGAPFPDRWLLKAPRRAGVLLHPTSLEGPGIGDLGPGLDRWLDWLFEAGQEVWQILPLVPVGTGGSPYDGLSALAGTELLLSPTLLVEDGLLPPGADADPGLPPGRVDYPRVMEWKDGLVGRAYRTYREDGVPGLRDPFLAFRAAERRWLGEYALFRALRRDHAGAPWTRWPAVERRRDPEGLARARARLAREVERFEFGQFLFHRQWERARSRARSRGIRILGDIPIFVAHDSADVWQHRELFRMDRDGRPEVVAGVPPDDFSATGQRWGNPIPDWPRMARDGYAWWTRRIQRTLEQVDLVRIDHFRGFEAGWEIPADAPTAERGAWRPGPGADLFRAVHDAVGSVPLVAEDLGLITPEVDRLRDELGFPGMRVLQFGFDGDPDNPHLPANHPENAVAYTGTHDNDTLRGWYEERLPATARARVDGLLGERGEGPVHRRLIGLVLDSPARLAVVPLQDVLWLGSEARMNAPGTTDERNWGWRLPPAALTVAAAHSLREDTEAAGRGMGGRTRPEP